jgi:hypothetical protein
MSLVFNFCNLTFFPTYFISVHKTLCRVTFGKYSQKTGTNVNTYCEISGSHGDRYEVVHVLGCCIM